MILAAADSPQLAPLFQLGAIGVVCAALLWFAFRVYGRLDAANEEARKALVAQLDREHARADKAEARLEAQNLAFTEKVLPVLIEANRVLVALERERR